MDIYVARDGKELGPLPADYVKSQLNQGALSPTDMAWYEGLSEWIPLSSVPGMVAIPSPFRQATIAPIAPLTTHSIKKDKFTNSEIVAIAKNFNNLLRITTWSILAWLGLVAIAVLLTVIFEPATSNPQEVEQNIFWLGIKIVGIVGINGWVTYRYAKALKLPRPWAWWVGECVCWLIPYIGGIVEIYLFVIIFYRGAKALKLSRPWAWGASQIVPLINLIMFGILYNKVNAAIRSKGLKLGFMGVRKGELEKLAFIIFSCSHCGQSLEVPQEMVGETVDCPACHGKIQLSEPTV